MLGNFFSFKSNIFEVFLERVRIRFLAGSRIEFVKKQTFGDKFLIKKKGESISQRNCFRCTLMLKPLRME